MHRIGRTGRAGATGLAISFCDGEERGFLRDIEKLTGKKIPAVTQLPEMPNRTVVNIAPGEMVETREYRGQQRRSEGRRDNRPARPAGPERRESNPLAPAARPKLGAGQAAPAPHSHAGATAVSEHKHGGRRPMGRAGQRVSGHHGHAPKSR